MSFFYPWPSHNGGPLKFGHGWIITSPSKLWVIITYPWLNRRWNVSLEEAQEDVRRKALQTTKCTVKLRHKKARKTYTWWRHQMESFSALLAICAGNTPVTGEFPTQWPLTRSFDVFFHLRLNKRLSKQWWGWWFETPSCPLWRLCKEILLSSTCT